MVLAGRIALLLALVRWTWIFIGWPMRQDVIGASFLHLINLPFHEAGHIFFAPFGDLLMSLGGSLTQIIVPLTCMIAFLTTSPNPFGAAVMAWWAGENLMDVAMYIDDARALQLVLLGGHTGAEVEGHDWERILLLTGALHRDHQLAGLVQLLGAALMLGALAWAIVIVTREKSKDRVDREVAKDTKPHETNSRKGLVSYSGSSCFRPALRFGFQTSPLLCQTTRPTKNGPSRSR